jgi:hypothetical protein
MTTHRHRLAALVAILTLVGAAACSDDEPGASDRDADDATAVEWELTGDGQAKDVDRAGEAPPAVRPFIALLCRSADKPDTFGITAERIQDTLVGPNRSIDGYLKEMSYGAMSIAGSRAAGWFVLPKASNAYADSVAGVQEITRDCAAAATAGGADLAPFSNVMVFTNGELNGALGTTTNRAPITVGGQPRDVTTVVLSGRGLNSPPLVLHELGHVFGGTHTSSPTDPLGGGAALGDAFDVPWTPKRNASIAPGYDASTRDAAGWIPTDRKARHAGGTQAYPLSRLTQPRPDGSLLVDVPIGSTTARYVVSVRTRIGYDEQASLENVTFLGYAVPEPGVVIEKVAAGTDTTTMRSSGTGDAATVWKAGQTFTDAANGITIVVDRLADDSAQVTVTAPGGSASSTTTAPATTAPATTSTTTTTAPPASTIPAQTAPVQTVPAEPTTTAPAPTGTTPTDDRDRAPLLPIPANIRVSSVGTGQAGEPQPCASIGSTVWFKVTMPASGQVTVSTVGSDYDTVLAFYADVTGGTGTSNLTDIGCVDDADGLAQAASPMNGPAGGTLYVQVGGYRGATGNLVISVT